MNIQTTRNNLLKIRDDLRFEFVERNEEIDMMFRSILSRQHCFFIGTPGIAKTDIVSALCKRVANSLQFKRLMRKDSPSEEVLGPFSLSALEHDDYRRVLDPKGGFQAGKTNNIVRAHIAVIDEANNASPGTLNGMLDVINERVFQNGGVEEKSNLVSAFFMSNHRHDKDECSAFWDRSLVRRVVVDIKEDANFEALLNRKCGNVSFVPSGSTITIDELLACIEDVKTVKVGTDVVAQIRDLRSKLNKIGIFNSPRRWVWCLDYLRAAAWLDNRTAVDSDDLLVLKDCLWELEPADELPKIVGILGELASPELAKVIETLDAAKASYDKTQGSGAHDAKVMIEANAKIRAAKKLIMKIARDTSSERVKSKATEAVKQIKKWHQDMLVTLGMGDDDEE